MPGGQAVDIVEVVHEGRKAHFNKRFNGNRLVEKRLQTISDQRILIFSHINTQSNILFWYLFFGILDSHSALASRLPPLA